VSRIELFCTKDSNLPVIPAVFEVFEVEKILELRRDVLQKSEDSGFGMFVSEDVENETLFRNESVPVFRNPVSQIRCRAPR
jgi:hypothetical protein